MPAPWKKFSTPSPSIYDIEELKKEIGTRFPFYDMKTTRKALLFYCNVDKENLETNFGTLRKSLSELGYIPLLRYEGGEHIIYVIKKPERKEKPVILNIILLIATIITTILTGSLLNMGYGDLQSLPNIIEVFSPVNLFWGTVLFSLPLMSILFIHEMGHYLISKRHDLHTSLPFFIPIPPILPGFNIGTFGALISSNDPMPDKKALFDVGISGPIAGFLVALPVTIIGIVTSQVISMDAVPPGEIALGSSLLFSLLSQAILNLPANTALDLNPIAFAGWIGMLITSINLLPAGQLDGGHIFRAVFGAKQKFAGWIAVFIMIITGWWFFAFIIIMLIGMEHPPPLNDDTELDMKRKLLFFIALAILILCYIPFPISYL
ncbi:site-2 protease family protein [Pseudomonadota bacterium]